MKRFIVALAMACSAAASALSVAADRVGDFALIDQKGYFHQLSYYDNHKAVALLVQSNGSKATAREIAAFKEAQAKYQGKIKFFMINPLGTELRDAVQQQVDQYGTDIPVLMDDTQLVSEALGINKTGEVLLLQPGSTQILYRGPAGKYLDRAIDDVVAGRAVAKAKVKTKGPAVTYPSRQAHAKTSISYSKDIAPILADNCARCHRQGGIAPFAMNSHLVIKGFAPMIREVVMTRRMPPGQIDPGIGHFKETYTLTPAETRKLVHWIEAGAQKDGNSDPLTELKWPATRCACIFTRGWVPIPPYAADHEMQQTITVPKDAHIYSMLPHMHFRGKRMRFYAEYPDGKKEELLNIAHYNYNWQLNYELAQPKLVPAGTKIRAVAAFDNSTQNKANRDPARSVPWGQQSWDEMFFGSVTYKFVDQSGTKVASQ